MRVISREIDRLLNDHEQRLSHEARLLLLGAGDSGKSTILRQMKLIYTNGFTDHDRKTWKPVVFNNMRTALESIISAMGPDDKAIAPENQKYIDIMIDEREIAPDDRFPHEYLNAFRDLWMDEAVQKMALRGGEYALFDNVFYFFADVDRLFDRNYLPTDQDILNARLKTTGISEEVFDLSPMTFRVLDVGGQRSERRKWIHCFENVQALLFIAAISGYDQCLVEDHDSNQMRESLMLFESVCNSQWFVNTPMILFLNKIDIFARRIKQSHIEATFPNYEGGSDYTKAADFFRQEFVSLNYSPTKDIYVHYTNATDTDLLRITMTSIQDMILQNDLRQLLL